jgi:hypothetical protein
MAPSMSGERLAGESVGALRVNGDIGFGGDDGDTYVIEEAARASFGST